MSRKILFQSLVLVFVLQGVILADEVLCSKPYEDTCPSTDNFFSCELILCVTNPDPDPEAFPVICPQDATEEVIQEDSEGNPKKYHLGLETVTEPNDPGYFYWWNHETVCSKTRACDEEENCNPSLGSFWCPANPATDPWADVKELWYDGVEGEECEITEE